MMHKLIKLLNLKRMPIWPIKKFKLTQLATSTIKKQNKCVVLGFFLSLNLNELENCLQPVKPVIPLMKITPITITSFIFNHVH